VLRLLAISWVCRWLWTRFRWIRSSVALRQDAKSSRRLLRMKVVTLTVCIGAVMQRRMNKLQLHVSDALFLGFDLGLHLLGAQRSLFFDLIRLRAVVLQSRGFFWHSFFLVPILHSPSPIQARLARGTSTLCHDLLPLQGLSLVLASHPKKICGGSRCTPRALSQLCTHHKGRHRYPLCYAAYPVEPLLF
jgi:hypothetical protein